MRVPGAYLFAATTRHGQWHRGDARGGDTNSERKRHSLVEVGKVEKKEEGEEAVKQAEAHCVQRENDDRDSASELTVEPRESANRSPIPKSAGTRAGSVVPEPPNCSDAFSRDGFSSRNALANTRNPLSRSSFKHASTHAHTHARTHALTRKRIKGESTEVHAEFDRG